MFELDRRPTRMRVIALARAWIGTPYHHQASAPGAGVDCIGLVRGVFRALYGHEPEALPGYSRDWAEATGTETLIVAARRHLVEIDAATAREGDVVVFRYRPRLVAKHAGILACGEPSSPALIVERSPSPDAACPSSGLTLIHAMEGAPVSEVNLSAWWRRRIAAAFAFPGVND